MLLIVLLLVTATGGVFAQAAESPRTAWPAYGLSIFLGFGTGHYYLGESGTMFLIGDAGGIAIMVGGYVYMYSALMSSVTSGSTSSSVSAITTGYAVVGVGAVIYLVSRVWEIVDIFGTTDRLRRDGKVVGLRPVIDARPDAVSFVLSYQY